MKNVAIKWLTLFAVAIAVSSCSMEKRLYSSGFHIQWHTKRVANSAGDKSDRQKPLSDKHAGASTNASSELSKSDATIAHDKTSPFSPETIAVSPSKSLGLLDRHNRNQALKSQQHAEDGLNQLAISARPKPRTGETDQQLAQRKANKAQTYENLCYLTLYVIYVSLILLAISAILKKQARSLSPDHKNVEAIPRLRPGETLEDVAHRKANKSLFYGILSVPTGVFGWGIFFGTLAIILGRDAEKFALHNPEIEKRAKAGIGWGVAGITLTILLGIALAVLLLYGWLWFF